MVNNVIEQNKGKNLIVVILVILLLAACGFICYDNFLRKNESSQKDCNCSICNDTSASSDTMKNESGKIIVKRNGIAKLESVPSDIVGQYQNKSGDYYKLNSDGTAEINSNTGCSGDCDSSDNPGLIKSNELTFQLSFVDDEHVIVEFYLNSKDHIYVPGGFLFGDKWNGSYSFMLAYGTPTTNACEQGQKFEKK